MMVLINAMFVMASIWDIHDVCKLDDGLHDCEVCSLQIRIRTSVIKGPVVYADKQLQHWIVFFHLIATV
jgi:hypothetical protein